MSDKTEEEIEIERARKGKRIMRPDDNPKETEAKARKQNPELDSANLSFSYEMYRREGGRGSLDDFMKQQQHALDILELTNPRKLSQEELKGAVDTKKEDIDHTIDELIFELEISDKNRLAIPYAMAANHFPPMIFQPNKKETLHLYDPLGKMWKMSLNFDTNNRNYVITRGWRRYLEHNHLIPPDLIRVYLPIPQKDSNDFNIQHKKMWKLLFEVVVPRSNRLQIPYSVGQKYFRPSDPKHLRECPINFTDFLDGKWEMRYILFEEEDVYIIVRGWEKYAAHHVLKYGDTVRFYKNRTRERGNNFTISAELSPGQDSILLDNGDDSPLCLRKNLLFELNLSQEDVRFWRLKMPGVEFPFECSGKEMLKLTDKNKKDWYVIIVYPKVRKEYMIIDGWEGIVREHKLEAGDMVRFFVPDDPDHDMHFLIKFAKRKKIDTKKEEGKSGFGKPEDGAGPSHKEKETAE